MSCGEDECKDSNKLLNLSSGLPESSHIAAADISPMMQKHMKRNGADREHILVLVHLLLLSILCLVYALMSRVWLV